MIYREPWQREAADDAASLAACEEAAECPLCGIRRWHAPDYDEGCCHVCAAEDEADATVDAFELAVAGAGR